MTEDEKCVSRAILFESSVCGVWCPSHAPQGFWLWTIKIYIGLHWSCITHKLDATFEMWPIRQYVLCICYGGLQKICPGYSAAWRTAQLDVLCMHLSSMALYYGRWKVASCWSCCDLVLVSVQFGVLCMHPKWMGNLITDDGQVVRKLTLFESSVCALWCPLHAPNFSGGLYHGWWEIEVNYIQFMYAISRRLSNAHLDLGLDTCNYDYDYYDCDYYFS